MYFPPANIFHKCTSTNIACQKLDPERVNKALCPFRFRLFLYLEKVGRLNGVERSYFHKTYHSERAFLKLVVLLSDISGAVEWVLSFAALGLHPR